MTNPKSALHLLQTPNLFLNHKFVGGESGAYAVTDTKGHKYVLKIYEYPEAAADLPRIQSLINSLGKRQYPAPPIIEVAGNQSYTVTLQAWVSGETLKPLTKTWLDPIFHLNSLQKDIAEIPSNWPKRLIDTLLLGAKGYCHHESLENYSPQTKNILHQLKHIGNSSKSVKCPKTDVVHFDFHGGNILTQGHQITGVIDWAGACIGDRLFDLATLMYYSYQEPTLRKPIEAEIFKHIPKDTLKLYYAHMILRQLDWSIRNHSQKTVEKHVKLSLTILEDYA